MTPIEVAILDSNIIKVLATTDVYGIVHQEIERLVQTIKSASTPVLPRIVIYVNSMRDKTDFAYLYASAETMAACELTEEIAEIIIQSCFIEKDNKKYVRLDASAMK